MKRRPPPQPDLFRPRAIQSPRAVERVQLVDLELERVPARDTDKAFCVRPDGGDDLVWLPRREVELDGSVFTLPRWLAVEKGLA